MVPVHAKSILSERIIFGYSSSCFCLSVSFSDKSKESIFNASYPSDPVRALAFLVFINNACIFCDLIFLFHFIFSDTTLDFVNKDA